MSHVDPETLAGIALGDHDLEAGADTHLRDCADCSAELAQLRRLVEVGSRVRSEDLPIQPPEPVWGAIRAAIDETRHAEADDRPRLAAPGRHPTESAPRNRIWWKLALAAAVGVLVGTVGAVVVQTVVRPDEQRIQETALLEPLPGRQGSGRAELVVSATDAASLRIFATVPRRPPGEDLEVWLLNTEDNTRMVSLGHLDQAGHADVPVPTWMLDGDYRIVDVSAEPRDGNPAHSGASEVRGVLR